jgi:hypothetical protein
VVGLLVVGSMSMRRSRRARRKQLRTAERKLSGRLLEFERENTRLREDLARRDLAARRSAGEAMTANLEVPAAARRSPSPLADHQGEPIYEEARRVARLRGNFDLSSPSAYG